MHTFPDVHRSYEVLSCLKRPPKKTTGNKDKLNTCYMAGDGITKSKPLFTQIVGGIQQI